jgi:hypothetical protein
MQGAEAEVERLRQALSKADAASQALEESSQRSRELER